jgi:formylglycine-generating enzyme required for sulfatase activity
MGVVDEADGEGLGVEGAAVGEIGVAGEAGREQPNARGSQWVTGGAAMGLALAVVAATWWSGAGNGDSWKIPVHAGAVVALIAGERTPNSGPGDFNSSNGSSHMKIQTTAAAALLGAAAIAFQAQAGDAVQWRVEDGGNGHWYGIVGGAGTIGWHESRGQAQDVGADLASVDSDTEWGFIRQIGSTPTAWNGQHGPWLGGYQDETAADFSEPAGGWRWVTGGPFVFTAWMNGQPSNSCDFHPENYLHMYGSPSNTIWNDVGEASTCSVSPVRAAVIEWSADCNSDGIVDYGQILSGQLADTNTNGIPDICECATHPELGACRCVGDIVTDGLVNGADLGTLLAYWGLTTSAPYSQASDINVDGRVDGADLGRLLANWGVCQYPGITVPAWATLIEAMPDPPVVTDPALRTAIAATGLAWRVRDTGTGIEMLLVPPGTFQMGCSQRSDSFPCVEWELPVHAVTITKPFYLGRHEVTQQQWGASMGSNPSTFQGRVDSDWRPVETVSWNAVQPYLAATNMRLPTEAEWEYACRAGTTTAFSNGSNDDSTIGSIAWWGSCCGGNSGGETRPVGTKPGNALGLNDMLGNVWEWVSDWFANYPTDAQVDPLGPTSGQLKPLRGGSWADDTHYVHSSYRYEAATPYNAYPQAGFRVARNP